MTQEIGTFTPEQARLLWQDYQQRAQLKPELQNNTRDRPVLPQSTVFRSGQLTTAITAASNELTGETSFTFEILAANSSGDLVLTGITTTGVNRDTSFTADIGDVIDLFYTGGEWRPLIGGGGGGANDCCCPCTCIDEGDIEVDGVETTSRWSVTLAEIREVQANGSLVLPAGTYLLDWSAGDGYWVEDVSAAMTAAYTSGNDATGDTTMTGTLILRKNDGGFTTLKLTFTGTVPVE